MKLETLKEKVSIIRGEGASAQSFTIDGDNMHLAIQAFYQYSDPIGSIIREITSNAYDAHIEAGTTKPVLVQIDETDSNIKILDFGVGLSPDRVRDVFTKFFSSTKRDDNNQIGAFGLGAKSPLSYSEVFQVRTKYGNQIYEYAVMKSDGIPDMVKVDECSYEEMTEECPWDKDENGTEISIPFHHSDLSTVHNSVAKQLRYFDRVLVNAPGYEGYNKEKIYRAKYFIYREPDFDSEYRNQKTHKPSGGLHICMGKVFYPISSIEDLYAGLSESDQNEVRLEALTEYESETGKSGDRIASMISDGARHLLDTLDEIPIGLYFDIGELPILWHRENIEYTKKAIKLILKRGIKAIYEIDEMQKEAIGEVDSLEKGLNLEHQQSEEPERDKKVYLSGKAFQLTRREVFLHGLENIEKHFETSRARYSTSLAVPKAFTGLLYSSHSEYQRYNLQNLVVKALLGKLEHMYWLEPGGVRKKGLKTYMKKRMPNATIIHPQEHLSDVMRNLAEYYKSRFAEDDKGASYMVAQIEKYHKEFWDLVEKRIPHVNEIEIDETFVVMEEKGQVSEMPFLYHPDPSLRGTDIQYRQADYKSTSNYSPVPPKMSMFVYGYKDDRVHINEYISYLNMDSMYRQAFGKKRNSYRSDNDVCYAIIGKHNEKLFRAVLEDDGIQMIYIKDLMIHRRGISNMVTSYLIGRYTESNPDLMHRLETSRSMWSSLRDGGFIGEEEYKKISRIFPPSNTPGNNPSGISKLQKKFIKYGLKKKYYHLDELEDLKWAHGMYLKYAPLLSYRELGRYDKKNVFERELAYRVADLVPQDIHPVLYRKFVKLSLNKHLAP